MLENCPVWVVLADGGVDLKPAGQFHEELDVRSSIELLSESGKELLAAISPDGKYILSAENDTGKQSLWLRNVATNSNTQVIPPSDAVYADLAFSPDGNYTYFREGQSNVGSSFNLYRAPVLGGTPHEIVRDIDSSVTFSPDGKHMAYVRANDPEIGKWRLLSVKMDGTDEKVLLIASGQSTAPQSLAWSTDGKLIAAGISIPGVTSGGIDLFDVATGKMRPLARFNNQFGTNVAWLPDGRGLLVRYTITGTFRSQIGFVSFPAGQFQPTTRDTSNYQTMDLSADGKTLAAVQARDVQTLYLVPGAGSRESSPRPAPPQEQNIGKFEWASNGQMLLSGEGKISGIAANGGERTLLISDPNANVGGAFPCASGRAFVFLSLSRGGTSGSNIWRADADGSNPVQLTHGMGEMFPVCSPDSKWVYYMDPTANQFMRVPFDGGSPEAVPGTDIPNGINGGFGPPGLSPNGKLLAFLASVTDPKTRLSSQKIGIVSLDSPSTSLPRLLDPNPNISGMPTPRFTRDGNVLAYPVRENGVDNLWLQPLDGSPGHQITNFSADRIRSFSFSPDGKTLAIIRFHTDSDVVLLRDSGAPAQ